MGMPAAAFWLFGTVIAGVGPGQRPAPEERSCVSSMKRRTWQAHSRLFYTPPTKHPPDVPPERRSIGSPHSTEF